MRMMKKTFIAIFLIMLTLPLIFVNLKPGQVSRYENRKLAASAKLYRDNGQLNHQYLRDVTTWFNDNMGFRSLLVSQHARIQYDLFHNLPSSNFRIGPQGEWNWVAEQVLPSYQHLNLFKPEEINTIYKSFVTVNQYLASRHVQFYYVQCWDKQSIYPEYFPTTVNQYGPITKTDQIVNRLKQDPSIALVDTKPRLLEAKERFETYSKFGDATHWADRGAYIGYLQLMQAINEHNEGQYRILQESDYHLNLVDKGTTFQGGIHRVNMSEAFTLKAPAAKLTNDKLSIDAEDRRCAFYTNTKCGNHTKVLIVGDSYIQSFIRDDLAESFYETAQVWKQNIADIQNLVDAYQPDIVIYEQAERELDFNPLIRAAKSIQESAPV